MRRYGWISLFVLLILAACGPPEVHDINGGGTVGDDDDDAVGDDDDDDDAASTFPTATTPPGAAPTLTNVPSFATFQSTIRGLANCAQAACHPGGSGGFYANTNNDPSNVKYLWFTTICNRAAGAGKAGTQTFNPPSGRLQAYFRGLPIDMNGDGDTNDGIEVHAEAGINTGTAGPQIVNWFTAAGVTATPPSCNDYYDLANSS